MILVLFLAAESQLSAFVQLISIAFSRNVHHDEVFSQLVVVSVIESDRVMVHLTCVVEDHHPRSVVWVDTRTTYCESN